MAFWNKKKKKSNAPPFQEEAEDMKRTYELARKTFGYYWREYTWEMHRIMPGVDALLVKVAIADGPGQAPEFMWVSGPGFDGETITGTLNNSPNWVTRVKEGDEIEAPFKDLCDWMVVMSPMSGNSGVYGGFVTSLMRATMSEAERQAHDASWGLEFFHPLEVHLSYAHEYGPALVLEEWYTKMMEGTLQLPDNRGDEHPMSINMAEAWREQFESGEAQPFATSPDGWSMLHTHAFAGNTSVVKLLLEMGQDPQAKTNHGKTPLDLAEVFNWIDTAELLRDAMSAS